MRILLMQFLHYQMHDRLPYRTDGRGGHVFYGVGSHFLLSSLRDRWYTLAFEAATIDQPEESVLEATRIRFKSEDCEVVAEQSVLAWEADHRMRTSESKYSGYRWKQGVKLDVEKPTLVTLTVDLKFSDHDDFIRAEGQTHLLADIHPGDPPTYYRKPMWYLRKWLGKDC